MENDISLVGGLALASLLPFIIACGTCYIKFSVVFVMVRNAIGLQQIPSNLTLNSIALILAAFVMMPFIREGLQVYHAIPEGERTVQSVVRQMDEGLSGYREYLIRYADPALTSWFDKAQRGHEDKGEGDESDEAGVPSLSALLPAYALTEIKDAFRIGFYLYLPFVVVDLLISSVLLALGMMMMSPVTISLPIKLLLFIVMDGWTLLSKGLIEQYITISG